MASIIPGNPAPVPRSDKLKLFLKSINLINWAESKTCRSHMSSIVDLDIRLNCLLYSITALQKISPRNVFMN